MTLAVNPNVGTIVITCDYDPTGLAWVVLQDHPVLAWMVDETSSGAPAYPILLRSLPATPPDNSPIQSPLWIMMEAGTAFAPSLMTLNRAPGKTSQYIVHGTLHDMFTAMSSNNGASRAIYANFYSYNLAVAWNHWAQDNSLALTNPPV
jgi:hypothetical protein